MATGDDMRPNGDQGLADKVGLLRRPDSYPERPSAVEAVETHMSWVFLTDRYAYKLKKPVRRDFLDFSTPAARKANSEAEVALNRRLAPRVYLGVVPLTHDRLGALQLGGPGAPVDWLVKMQRLPHAQMLDAQIASGTLSRADLEPAAELLARFFAAAPPLNIAPDAYCRRHRRDIEDNRRVLLDSRYAMPQDRVRRICTAQLAFLGEEPNLLAGRARERRIVEGHGDLRPEHICLGPEPAIIDCIEFNRDFRVLDPADELAFLSLECEFQGASFVGQNFLQVYRCIARDAPPAQLFSFYKSLRACLRCKLSLWHLDDPTVADPEPWRHKARRYLDFALEYAGEFAGERDLHGIGPGAGS